MPILDLYTRDNQKALEAQAELGRREIPKEVGIFDGVLSATGKGLGAAALETGRALTYAAGITPSGAIYKGLRDGAAPSLDKWFDESEYGKKLGETVKGLQPDPQTTGKAASIMFEVARMGGKAVGHVMTAGPAAPLTFGLDEGATETFKLTDQGVDAGTAIAAGAVHGAASAVGMALPAAGKTLKATAGLVVGGGPASFMGEQAAISAILESADYAAIAKKYDPFDVTGLALSTIAPAAFGVAVHGARARADAKLTADKAATETPPAKPGDTAAVKADSEPDLMAMAAKDAPPAELVDAAHVANLQRHQSVVSPDGGISAKVAKAHAERVDAAVEAMDAGKKPVVIPPERQLTMSKTVDTPNGRSLPARDSTGQPVAPTPEAVIEFHDWFGASKAVDADGAPMVMRRSEIEGELVIRPDSTPGKVPDATPDRGAEPRPEADAPPAQPVYVRADRIAGTADAPLPPILGTPEALRATRHDAAWVVGKDGRAELRVASPEQIRPAVRMDTAGPDLRSMANEAPGGRSPTDPPGTREAAPDKAAARSPTAAPAKSDTPGSPKVDDADAASEQLAREIVDADPDMRVELDDGSTMTARELLEQADAEVARAEKESGAFAAAVNCLLRTG